MNTHCELHECNNKLPKGRRKFCCNKHKDKYHNRVNPRGYGLLRTASTKHPDGCICDRCVESYFHPFDLED